MLRNNIWGTGLDHAHEVHDRIRVDIHITKFPIFTIFYNSIFDKVLSFGSYIQDHLKRVTIKNIKGKLISMIEDSDILFSIKRNSETGFRLLMSIYREPAYWHIRRMVVHHADAQDATQETFIRVFRSISRFRGDSSLRVWIYRIATNEAIQQMGRKHDEYLSVDDGHSEARQLVAEEYVNYEDAEAVKFQNAILSLPLKQQLAFTTDRIMNVGTTSDFHRRVTFPRRYRKIRC